MVVTLRVPRSQWRLWATMAGGLLFLAAVACLMLALWRLTFDLGWTDPFAIQEGLFSHWQVWLALTFATGGVAQRILRTPGGWEAESAAPELEPGGHGAVDPVGERARAATANRLRS